MRIALKPINYLWIEESCHPEGCWTTLEDPGGELSVPV